MKKFDVIVIGAGPAGIFVSLELLKLDPKLDILLLEKGKDIAERTCPVNIKNIKCINCKPCSIMNGWGGAGAYSDGKLTLTTEFGGWLQEYIGKNALAELIHYVDEIYLSFGATDKIYGQYNDIVREIERRAAIANLKLIPAEIRHLGTEKNFQILKRMREYLDDKIQVHTKSIVRHLIVDEGKLHGVELENGEKFYGRYVVCAPGREGAEWFTEECNRLGLELLNNQVDIGVRVEVPASILEHITKHVYEAKLVYYTKSFDDYVRTFCMNPYGEVVLENTSGLITVNGHSFAEKKTRNTNFAILVSKRFTEPFKEPIAYGKSIAKLANMLSSGVIVQRFGDLKRGRRSTQERINRGMVVPTLKDATPGDLSLVLPHRHLVDIVEMLEAMESVAPGIASDHTLLYGIEVKFYSSRLKLTEELETGIANLFAVGDGAGVTRGLVQAAASGVVVAREIYNRVKG